MKKLSALLTIALLFSFGCQKKSDNSSVNDTSQNEDEIISFEDCGGQIGDHPCDFTFTDQNGEPWQLYKNYGDIILIDFSTMWCSYCQISAQKAEEIQRRYASHNFKWS